MKAPCQTKRFAAAVLALVLVAAFMLSPALALSSDGQPGAQRESSAVPTEGLPGPVPPVQETGGGNASEPVPPRHAPEASSQTQSQAVIPQKVPPQAQGAAAPLRWLFEGMQVRGLDGDVLGQVTGAEDESVQARLWIRGDADLDLEAKDPSAAPFTFLSRDLGQPAPEAPEFDTPPAATHISLPDPATDSGAYPLALYARADADCVFNGGTPDEIRLVAGQVLRLPTVCLDKNGPYQQGSAPFGPGRFFGGTLYATDTTLSVGVQDFHESVPGQENTVSGLAAASLLHDGTVLQTVELKHPDRAGTDAQFLFELNDPGSYQTGGFAVEMRDIAGNRTLAAVSGFVDMSGQSLDGADVVLSDDRPSVSLAYEPAESTQPGFYGARIAVASVSDPHIADLIAWHDTLSPQEQDALPPVCVIQKETLGPPGTGTEIPITLDMLQAAGTGMAQARIDIDTSGRYRVAEASGTPPYQGIVPGLGADWAPGSNLAPFAVDLDAPQAGPVTILPDAPVAFGSLFSPSEVTVLFELSDGESGIDPGSVRLTADGVGYDLEVDEQDDSRFSTAAWQVPAGGIDLDGVSLVFRDRAGHESSIDSLLGYADKNIDVGHIYAHTPRPEMDVAFDNDDVRNGRYYKEARTATITLSDTTFGVLKANDPDRAVVLRTLDGDERVYRAREFAQDPHSAGTWTAEVICSADGSYTLSNAYAEDLAGQEVGSFESQEFVIDQAPPLAGQVRTAPAAPLYGGWLFAQDGAEVAFGLEDGTSGIDTAQVLLTESGQEQALVCTPAGNGLDAQAVWDVQTQDRAVGFSEVSLSFADRAGNASYIHSLGAYPNKDPDIEGVFVDTAAPLISVSFDNNDVRNNKYYNAPRIAAVTVKEASFGFVRDNEPDRTVAVRHHGNEQTPVPASSFENPSGDNLTWVAYIPCDTDGTYRIEADLTDPSGRAAQPYRGEEFVLDTQAPSAGAVRISPEATQEWGWLFAQGGISMDITLADAVSGIDPATVQVSGPAGTQDIACSDNTAGSPGYEAVAVWDIPAQDQAIALGDVSLAFADLAGNRSSVDNMDTHGQRNIEAAGVFADAAEPVISVSFDNNDVRNGSYYNAPRIATITLEEASFGFVRANDPRRPVATQYRDQAHKTVYAEDFENPSGDGTTWVAHLACDTDGTYRIEAGFTDPSGRTAQPYRSEEFVVDTTAPLILLTFDNNDAQSGMYFKAPRTASLVVLDDNFSPGLTAVAVSASDAAGAGVPAPGASAWTEAGEGEWRSAVAFSQELHYTLEVTSTDLAGNAAEPAAEPEFVIDMTLPEVSVERVEDRAAYKDQIAPRVTFSDQNFEPYLSEVSITGSRQEEPAYHQAAETLGENSRTLEYADFDYEVQTDDVYTLTASVKDRAGNEAQETVVFSVNRFGSNYELSAASKALLGSFVKRGQDVVLTETNVSGLEQSSLAVVHNGQARELDPGKDFSVGSEGGEDAWSRYTYTLPARLFAQDGYYRVLLSSVDQAGGLSENLMPGKNSDRTAALDIAFAVDGTSPTATMGNIDQHTSYHAPSRSVEVYAGDNILAESAVATIDGRRVAEWDAEALRGTGALAFDVPAAEHGQELALEVRDYAGNTTLVSAEQVLVTNDLVLHVLNTPDILYPLVAVCVVVCAAALLLALGVAGSRRTKAAGGGKPLVQGAVRRR